ncbi:MAG: STN domain-containing protein [Pseudomonadota bacterium]
MLLAASGSTASETLASLRAYDIVAQPLDAALNAYIRSSGTQVFYETALTAGLTARQVKGQLTPEAALLELLSGTGLVARRTDVDAFVIVSIPRSQAARATPAARPGLQFITALQSGVVDALCRTERTRPGAYRVAVELWIAETGAIQRASLIGSTGDTGRDRALIAVLSGVPIGMAPPPNSLQPFILSIGARVPGETGDCQG